MIKRIIMLLLLGMAITAKAQTGFATMPFYYVKVEKQITDTTIHGPHEPVESPNAATWLNTFTRYWWLDEHGDTLVAGTIRGARHMTEISSERDDWMRKYYISQEEIRTLKNIIEAKKVEIQILKAGK